MRTRKEYNFRNVSSKSGEFCPHISQQTTERIIRYCKKTNKNKTKFVEECINDRLNVLERELLNSLSKEELIELLMTE